MLLANRRSILSSIMASIGTKSVRAQLYARRGFVQKRISLLDFDMSDEKISASVRSAIAELPSTGGATLHFPPGNYKFPAHADPIIYLHGIENLELNAAGANFSFSGIKNPIIARNCPNLRLTGFTVDWQKPPFSQGEVIYVSNDKMSFSVKMDDSFPVDGTENIQSFVTYDRQARSMKLGGIDSGAVVAHTQMIGLQTLRISLTKAFCLTVGEVVVMKHKGFCNSISLECCDNISIENVSVYSSPGMAIVANQCKDMLIKYVKIIPKLDSNRLMSTCADGLHFVSCTGKIVIDKCHISNTGDDCININAPYYKIYKKTGGNGVILSDRKGLEIDDISRKFVPGQSISIFSQDDLSLLNEALVDWHSTDRNNVLNIVTNDVVRYNIGDLVLSNGPKPIIIIRNSLFSDNRARAILSHQNVTIEHCEFHGQFESAILLGPDTFWLEGGVADHVVIRNNCFYSIPRKGASVAVIVVDARVSTDGHTVHSSRGYPNRTISISSNKFSNCLSTILEVKSTNGVTFIGNSIRNCFSNIIKIYQSKNISISDNQCIPNGTVEHEGIADEFHNFSNNARISLSVRK